MKKLLSYLRYRWLLFQWKRRSKKKRRANVRIGRLNDFFAALEQRKIAYVVLRWFAEVPANRVDENSFTGDIDMLVESAQLEEFCRTVAEFPGRVKVDLYSNGIRLGTDCKRIAYFPPVLGTELLQERILFEKRFFRPSSRLYLYSLLYHCVYQKGLLCGLPTGTDLLNTAKFPHDLEEELARTAAECGEKLPERLTLLSIHQWLQQRNWAMPYDLLGRWPTRNAWHEELLARETAVLLQELGKLKDMLVFLIREDAVKTAADAEIIKALQAKFLFLAQVRLDAEQQRRVMRETRGGDWTKHKEYLLVAPVIAVVCHDPCPQNIEGQSLAAIHHFVSNGNIFYKHEIRREMELRFPGAINFMHGSDNDAESMAYIKAIYGSSWPEMLAAWEGMLEQYRNKQCKIV
ncbi:MAG: hypothetical protein WCT05_16645 [Lentisphaeria bacterium]